MSKRIRRTNEQIVNDLAAQINADKPELQFNECLKIALERFNTKKNKTIKTEIKPSHEASEPMTQVKNAIEMIPVTNTVNTNNELELEKAIHKASSNVTASILTEVDKRIDLLINKVNQASVPNQFIVGIKINDSEVIKFESGAHEKLPELVAYSKAQNKINGTQYPALFGPAGCGKTQLAEQLAKALSLEFYHLTFTAGVSETWLFGRQTVGGFVEGPFSKAYRNGGLFLADEMDAADANLLLSINTALSNGHLFNPISGEQIPRHKDFYFIAAMNTIGKGSDQHYTGRNRLDAATLNRFLFWQLNYIASIEQACCPDKQLLDRLRNCRKDLGEIGSSEIISYRTLLTASLLASLGKSHDEIIKHLTLTFSDEAKQICGIK